MLFFYDDFQGRTSNSFVGTGFHTAVFCRLLMAASYTLWKKPLLACDEKTHCRRATVDAPRIRIPVDVETTDVDLMLIDCQDYYDTIPALDRTIKHQMLPTSLSERGRLFLELLQPAPPVGFTKALLFARCIINTKSTARQILPKQIH